MSTSTTGQKLYLSYVLEDVISGPAMKTPKAVYKALLPYYRDYAANEEEFKELLLDLSTDFDGIYGFKWSRF